jgi:hypothetical protein
VAIAFAGDSSGGEVWTSPDGIDWTLEETLPTYLEGINSFITTGEESQALVPTMSDNVTPAGYVVSLGSIGTTNEEDWHFVFDNDGGTRVAFTSLVGVIDPATEYVQVQLPVAKTATRYELKTLQSLPEQAAPTAWTFKGSNDGLAWTTLDTQSDVGDWVDNVAKNFAIASPAAFSYYRISFVATIGSSSAVISALQLFGTWDSDVCSYMISTWP